LDALGLRCQCCWTSKLVPSAIPALALQYIFQLTTHQIHAHVRSILLQKLMQSSQLPAAVAAAKTQQQQHQQTSKAMGRAHGHATLAWMTRS
jgi:hypothetical protein